MRLGEENSVGILDPLFRSGGGDVGCDSFTRHATNEYLCPNKHNYHGIRILAIPSAPAPRSLAFAAGWADVALHIYRHGHRGDRGAVEVGSRSSP